jgi:hypothetical protein
MGVTLEQPWWAQANAVHRACFSYGRATRETDPHELCSWVMKCVPGGRVEAWWELSDGSWVPALDVSFRHGARYRVERLAARYRAGDPLTVVEE